MKRFLFVAALMLTLVAPVFAGQVARREPNDPGYTPCACWCFKLFGTRYCVCVCDGGTETANG